MDDDQKKSNEKLSSTQQRKESQYHFFIYNGAPLIPGIVRMRDAPYYLGMNKTFFREKVQPYLTRIPIDKKGIGFARMELDQWIAYTQATVGQPPKEPPPWENFHTTAEDKPLTRAIVYKNPLKKLKVKKTSLRGKPTPQDLEALIKKSLTIDDHS